MTQILILETDGKLKQVLERELPQSVSIQGVADKEDAFQYAVRQSPDAIVIMLGADIEDLANLCERLRTNALTQKTPLFTIDTHIQRPNMELLYGKGADDYLALSVGSEELPHRLMARIRRFEEIKPRHHALGNMVLVPERHEVQVDGKSHHLSPLEFQLLRVFVANPNRSISRPELLNSIWGDVAVSNRTVDVHVSTLRRKLTNFNFSIDSIYGSGYILRETSPARN